MTEREHFTKEQILEQCKNAKPIPDRNSMGCSESWYDPFFCLQQIFTEGELGAMTEQELNNLYRLVDEMTRTFYYMSNHREYLDNCMNIIRGIRNATDATEELNLVDQYKWFSHMIRFEFIPLIAKPKYRSVSSSLVREMVKYLPLDEIPVPEPVAVLMSKEGK